MGRDELLGWIRNVMVEVREGLSASQVIEDASLFYDLGFDSLAFENLLSRVKSRYGDADLTPWYVRASSEGDDTVGSLVDYLSLLPPAAATAEASS